MVSCRPQKDDFNIKILPANIEAVIYLAQSKIIKLIFQKVFNIHFRDKYSKTIKNVRLCEKRKKKNSYMHPVVCVYRQEKMVQKQHLLLSSKMDKMVFIYLVLCSEVLADNYKQFMMYNLTFVFLFMEKSEKANMLIPRLFANIKKGVPIKLQGSNGLSLNPIHVSDVVSSVLQKL